MLVNAKLCCACDSMKVAEETAQESGNEAESGHCFERRMEVGEHTTHFETLRGGCGTT